MTEKAYERFYDAIINDDSLTEQQKADAIKDLDRDYRDAQMEQRHREEEEREMERKFGNR